MPVPSDPDDPYLSPDPNAAILEVERDLLALMLAYPGVTATVRTKVPGRGYFYRPLHQSIYGFALALDDRGDPVIPTSVIIEAREAGLSEEVVRTNWAGYMQGLLSRARTPGNAGYLALKIADAGRRRLVTEAIDRARQRVEESDAPVDDVIGDLRDALADGHVGGDVGDAGGPAPPSSLHRKALAEQRARTWAANAVRLEEAQRVWTPPTSYGSLADELAMPDEPISYSIDRLHPAGSNRLVTAQYKTGKTTYLLNEVRCLADGRHLLGEYKTDLTGTIAFWNYEVEERWMRKWFSEGGISNAHKVFLLHLRGMRMPLLNPVTADWVVEWLRERNITTWYLDPWARVMSGNGSENSNDDVTAVTEMLDEIKRRAGVVDLVITAHTGRAIQEEGSERARGATRLDDWPDVRQLLTKDDLGRRYMSAHGRGVDLEEVRLDFDPDNRHLSIGGEGRRAAKANEYRDAVVTLVTDCPGLGVRELKREIGGNEHGVDDGIRQALVDGLIVRRAEGNRKQAHYPVEPSDASDAR